MYTLPTAAVEPVEAGLPSFSFWITPVLVLVCIAIFLFGAVTVQVYVYWITYENDTTFLRGSVLVLWALECTHTAVCIHILYHYLIANVGNPLAAIGIVWSTPISVILEVIVSSMTQTFYIYRIWGLSSHSIRAILLPAFLVICRLSFGIASGHYMLVNATYQEYFFHTASRVVSNCSLSFGALIDLVACALLNYYLRKHQSNFRRTQHMVQFVTFYTINTGTLTMMVSIATVLVFNLVTTSLLCVGLIEVLSKLYANTMLGLLNSRQHIKNKGRSPNGLQSFHLSAIRGQHSNPTPSAAGVHVDIYKETSTVVGEDTAVEQVSDTPLYKSKV